MSITTDTVSMIVDFQDSFKVEETPSSQRDSTEKAGGIRAKLALDLPRRNSLSDSFSKRTTVSFSRAKSTSSLVSEPGTASTERTISWQSSMDSPPAYYDDSPPAYYDDSPPAYNSPKKSASPLSLKRTFPMQKMDLLKNRPSSPRKGTFTKKMQKMDLLRKRPPSPPKGTFIKKMQKMGLLRKRPSSPPPAYRVSSSSSSNTPSHSSELESRVVFSVFSDGFSIAKGYVIIEDSHGESSVKNLVSITPYKIPNLKDTQSFGKVRNSIYKNPNLVTVVLYNSNPGPGETQFETKAGMQIYQNDKGEIVLRESILKGAEKPGVYRFAKKQASDIFKTIHPVLALNNPLCGTAFNPLPAPREKTTTAQAIRLLSPLSPNQEPFIDTVLRHAINVTTAITSREPVREYTDASTAQGERIREGNKLEKIIDTNEKEKIDNFFIKKLDQSARLMLEQRSSEVTSPAHDESLIIYKGTPINTVGVLYNPKVSPQFMQGRELVDIRPFKLPLLQNNSFGEIIGSVEKYNALFTATFFNPDREIFETEELVQFVDGILVQGASKVVETKLRSQDPRPQLSERACKSMQEGSLRHMYAVPENALYI